MIDITNDECIVVTPDDRLGIYFDEMPWAVGYTFTPPVGQGRPPTLVFNSNASQPIQLADTVDFGQVSIPYEFSVTAYIDTGILIVYRCNIAFH